MTGRTIVLSGASGFLGGAIAARLRRAGAVVLGLSRQAHDDRVVVDLEAPDAAARLDALPAVDAVVHCAAALPGRRADAELPDANERMTLALARWAGRRGVPHFVLASSCSVYGPVVEPCVETAPAAPASAYARSKLASEQVVAAVAAETGMRACTLRISAPYGPGLRADTVLRRFLRDAAAGEPLRLLGTGGRTQDFVHEDDVAEAFFLALSAGASGVHNVSGGHPVTMRELAATVLRVLGRPADRVALGPAPDPQESYRGSFPSDSAARAFGYRARVGLAEGLAGTARAWGLA